MSSTSQKTVAVDTFAGVHMPERWAAKLRISCRRGLVVIAGPTGSGKSTAAKRALLDVFGDGRHRVIALQDVGEDLSELAETGISVIPPNDADPRRALYQMLRAAPDAILVGEVRDRQMLQTVYEIVATGHTVFMTLHALDVESAIERMRSMSQDIPFDGPTTIIACSLVKSGEGRVMVCDSHTNAETVFRHALQNGLSKYISTRDALQRSKPTGYFSMAQHAAHLVETRLLTETEAIGTDYSSFLPAAPLVSATDVLTQFHGPRELRPLVIDEELLSEIATLRALGWSTVEIAAMLTFGGFEADAEAIHAALYPAKNSTTKRKGKKKKVTAKSNAMRKKARRRR